MANADNPHGFAPLLVNLGGGRSVIQEFTKDVDETTAIFRNDLVNREADGNIAPGGTPGTTTYTGVALNHGAASTVTQHSVVISPDALFEGQDNNDTDGIAAADLGLNANAEFNGGDANTLLSGHEIDESTVNTSAARDLKMLNLYNVPDNAHGANARIEVVINNHRLAPGVAGV